MDPVSAFGIIAGALQIADSSANALLASVRIVKDAKTTPKWLKDLLHDVENSVDHVSNLKGVLEGLNSLLDGVSANQLHQAKVNLTSISEAAVSFKNILKPLVNVQGASNHYKLKRINAAMKSVVERSNIEQQALRLLLLNQTLSVSLEGIILESQGFLARQIRLRLLPGQSQIEGQLRTLKPICHKIQREIRGQQLTIKSIQRQAAHTRFKIARMHDQYAGISKILDVVDNRTIMIEAKSEINYANIRLEQERFQDMLRSSREECAATRQDVARLRTDFMQWIAGSHVGSSSPSGPDSRLLRDAMNHDLSLGLEHILTDTPSALNDACEKISNSLLRKTRCSSTADYLMKYGCSCTPVPSRWIIKRGVITFAYESFSTHSPRCRVYQQQKSLESYILAIQLLPMLGRTLAFTITKTSGAGGCSIGSCLSSYRTVRRSESDLFKLFDGFPGRLSRKICHNATRFVTAGHLVFVYNDNCQNPEEASIRDKVSIQFSCTLEEVENEIQKFVESFTELLHRGSVWDKDEYGNTCLHELVYLASYFGLAFTQKGEKLRKLVKESIAPYIDSLERSKPGLYRPYVAYNIWQCETWTAVDTAVALAVEFPQSFRNIPFQEAMGDICFADRGNVIRDLFDHEYHFALLTTFTNPCGRDVSRQANILRLLQCYPDLLEYFGYGMLERAILTRRDDQLQRVLDSDIEICKDSERNGGLYPLDLALRWPSGLQKLLEFGHDPKYTLELSIHLRDLVSTKALLKAENFSLSANPLILCGASEVDDPLIQKCVIDALTHGREQLRAVAVEHLPTLKSNLHECLSGERVLNARALDVWNALRIAGVDVDKKLFPGRMVTIYQFVSSQSRLDFLEALHTAGFESVDGAHRSLGTPLLRLLNYTNLGQTNNDDLIAWFLEKQASPYFIAEHSFPTALFYLSFDYHSLRCNSKFLRETLPLVSSVCDPLYTDDCYCFCSSRGGCLVAHKLWSCDPHMLNHDTCLLKTRAVLTTRLQEWLQFAQIDEAVASVYYDEMCRVEIFDRLGLAHTCCTVFDGFYVKRKTFEEEMRNELHEEDSTLREQLELIIEEYQRLKGIYPGTILEFWERWWARLDMILPELSPQERCRRDRSGNDSGWHDIKPGSDIQRKIRVLSNLRAVAEESALRKLGYYGWGFEDVIRMHLQHI